MAIFSRILLFEKWIWVYIRTARLIILQFFQPKIRPFTNFMQFRCINWRNIGPGIFWNAQSCWQVFEKKNKSNPSWNPGFETTFKKTRGLAYPINTARNIAREMSNTHFFLAGDIELYPNQNLPKDFLSMIKKNPSLLKGNLKTLLNLIQTEHFTIFKPQNLSIDISEPLKMRHGHCRTEC